MKLKYFSLHVGFSPLRLRWKIYGFVLSEIYPVVMSLQLHLEDQRLISFRKYDNLARIINDDSSSRTMLTEYFRMNQTNKKAQKILYNEFPEHFVWNQRNKLWTPRKQRNVIGRIVVTNYLHLMLNHLKGATSFLDLKTINGVIMPSFREAALFCGLLKSDNNLEQCLQEACLYQIPYCLRRLFATILVYCNPSNPKALWKKFEGPMSEDYKKFGNLSLKSIRIKVLQHINGMLESMGKNVDIFGLTDSKISLDEEEKGSKEIEDELKIVVSEQDILTISNLNKGQRYAYDMVLERVIKDKPNAFFIDGPSSTSKTYLYRVILATVRSKGFIALATATSRVVASLLPGGKTAHL